MKILYKFLSNFLSMQFILKVVLVLIEKQPESISCSAKQSILLMTVRWNRTSNQ